MKSIFKLETIFTFLPAKIVVYNRSVKVKVKVVVNILSSSFTNDRFCKKNKF